MPDYQGAVHTYVAAINSMDPIAFAACFSANAHIQLPLTEPPHMGSGGARIFLAQFVPFIETLHMRIGKIYIADVQAAYTWEVEARFANGRCAAADGIDTIEFDAEGKIVQVRGYWDWDPFLTAMTT